MTRGKYCLIFVVSLTTKPKHNTMESFFDGKKGWVESPNSCSNNFIVYPWGVLAWDYQPTRKMVKEGRKIVRNWFLENDPDGLKAEKFFDTQELLRLCKKERMFVFQNIEGWKVFFTVRPTYATTKKVLIRKTY